LAAIDIGSAALDRSAYNWGGQTFIDKANPANDTGTLTSFEFWFDAARENATGVYAGTFSGSGASWNDRDYEIIGTVIKGSKQTFSGLHCDVTVNDIIGAYWDNYTGGLELSMTGGTSVGNVPGNQFGQAAKTYDFTSGYAQSVYGTGVTIVDPTVTTQAATNVGATTATGNGNVTATGGDTVTAWGVCVCLASHSETPDTGDSVFAGSGAGQGGAFTAAITSLTTNTNYHLRAYATNSLRTSYGATVELNVKSYTHIIQDYKSRPISTAECKAYNYNSTLIETQYTDNGIATFIALPIDESLYIETWWGSHFTRVDNIFCSSSATILDMVTKSHVQNTDTTVNGVRTALPSLPALGEVYLG